MPDLEIDYLDGWCPVQAEGKICGKEFYFRARGQKWYLGIGGDPIGFAAEWSRSEPWGTDPFDAGWMPLEDARAIIDRCVAEYIKEQGK